MILDRYIVGSSVQHASRRVKPSTRPNDVTAVFPDEFLQGRTKDLDPLWNLFFVGSLLADGPSHGGFSFSQEFR